MWLTAVMIYIRGLNSNSQIILKANVNHVSYRKRCCHIRDWHDLIAIHRRHCIETDPSPSPLSTAHQNEVPPLCSYFHCKLLGSSLFNFCENNVLWGMVENTMPLLPLSFAWPLLTSLKMPHSLIPSHVCSLVQPSHCEPKACMPLALLDIVVKNWSCG